MWKSPSMGPLLDRQGTGHWQVRLIEERDSPLVHCSILWNKTGYLVIRWVTSNMHSGIPSLRTTELLIFFCKGGDQMSGTTRRGRLKLNLTGTPGSEQQWGIPHFMSLPSRRPESACLWCGGLWSSSQTGCAAHKTCHMSSLSVQHSPPRTVEESE